MLPRENSVIFGGRTVLERRKRKSWRGELKWFLLTFALANIGLVFVMDWRGPTLYDLEYGTRLALLHQRQAEAPKRPTALVVGSSRIGLGFLPERMSALRSASGELVLPFNFSHLAAGPATNLATLHRLLRENVRPRWILLEVNAPCMVHEGASMPVTTSCAADLPLLQRYFNPWLVWGVFLRSRINPWYGRRLGIQRYCAPAWATDAGGEDRITLGPLGGDAGWMLETQIDAETRRRRTEAVRAIYWEGLQDYHINPLTDRAVRESLQLCRRERVDCALLLTPESQEFRGWYSAAGMSCFERYCAELAKEYSIPVVDARTWLANDQFTDGHHPLRAGAETFTERLEREALQPLVQGRLRKKAPGAGRDGGSSDRLDFILSAD